ncbi:NAD-dependent epimerase/dehydratase family protein [Aquihabitans sp. McL0605]|uniref:NAD-dependent epimerase/dehydratase family protein n=1 Tax=Aquihabitans sp. McL0605 TaxID=3415671 RepID=UPI003CF594ED
MKVMVTGAAGFIGSHLAEALVAEGHAVVGLDCFTDYYPRPQKEANLAGLRASDAFTFVEADLRTADLDPLVEGCDVVVNEAAMPGLLLGWDGFDTYLSCNVIAAERLGSACLRAGVGHLVHASTSSVYGADATGSEDGALAPVSPYGATKLATELVLDTMHRSEGLPVTILRYFSVYGPRQRPDMAYRALGERMLRGEPLTIHGDGHQSRTNTYVTDCVAATMAAIASPQPGERFNIGGGQELTLLEAVAILAKVLDVQPELVFEAARAGDQRRTVADYSKANEVFGWSPLVDPVEGLQREAAWLRGLVG